MPSAPLSSLPYVDVTFPVAFRLYEPTTCVTDLVLAGVFFWAAASLPAAATAAAATLRRLWLSFFLVVGVSPVLGAVVHGLGWGAGAVWKANLVCVCAGVWSMECIALHWLTRGARAWWHAPLRVAFTAQVLYATYYIVYVSAAFVVVIVDYAPTQLVITALHAVAAWRGAGAATAFGRSHAAATRTLLGGMALLLVAAACQAARVSPHRWFNHNDLFHVVQCYSTWLLFRGAAAAIRAFDARDKKRRS